MKKFIAIVLLGLCVFGALAPAYAETDYPSAQALNRLITRVERIMDQLDRLEAAVALIPTES